MYGFKMRDFVELAVAIILLVALISGTIYFFAALFETDAQAQDGNASSVVSNYENVRFPIQGNDQVVQGNDQLLQGN